MAERKMEDDEFGLKGRAPMCPDMEVVTLSPILDTAEGMVYGYGSFNGDVPPDPAGYCGPGYDSGKKEKRNGKR